MFVSQTTLQAWWPTLSPAWQELIAAQLDLEGCFSKADLAYVSTLTELEGRRSGLTDLQPLLYLPQLTVLDVSENWIADYGPLGSLPRLRELHLTGTPGLDLTVLTALPQLEVLDISYPLHPHTHLEALGRLSRLRHLYCNACHLDSLGFLSHLPHLEILTIPFNPLGTEEVKAFAASRPQCQVLF